MMIFKVILVFITVFAYTNGGRILGIFPMAGISHQILAKKLMKGLAEGGHDVTMVSPSPLKDLLKNVSYTDIVLDGLEEQYQVLLKEFNLFERSTGALGMMARYKAMMDLFTNMLNDTMHHPKMKQLVESKLKFDVLIMEQFMNDAHKVYAYLFDCPLILLSSMGPNGWVNPTVGNPQPISYAPHFQLEDFSRELSFSSRLKNLLLHISDYFVARLLIWPGQERIKASVYPNTPNVADLYTNVSLVLLNSHTSLYSAVPLVPNMIEIGGYFIDPPKKLPKELQEYMDNATEGVIYFSMGSNLKSKDIPEERKQLLLRVFGKLKQKVIWKFEEDLPGRPSNVMIQKWCPQQDILAHPNVRLFITHGGLLSTTETVYHGVPILAIPVFADQPANAARAEAQGYGLKLGYHNSDFTEERLSYLLNELLHNSKYRETVKEKSRIFHDRPSKPMDTALYWVDYVIRHKGAPHLRVAGSRLPWYKYFMVDVIGATIFIVLLVIYILKLAVRALFYRLCSVKGLKKQKTL